MLYPYTPSIAQRTPVAMALSKKECSPRHANVWYSPAFLGLLRTHSICTIIDLLKYCFSVHANADINSLPVLSRIKLLLPDDNNAELASVVLQAITSELLMPVGMPIVVSWLPYEGASDAAAVPYQCTLGAVSLLSPEIGTRFVKSADGQFTEHVPVQLHLDDIAIDWNQPWFEPKHTLPVVKYDNGLYIGTLNELFLPEGNGRLLTTEGPKIGIWKAGKLVELTTPL